MESLYQEIIKDESIFFRGMPLGIKMNQVEEIEGEKYRKKTGSTPCLHYHWECGDIEEIDLYFGLETDLETINEIRLLFYSYPDFYHEQATGGNLGEFDRLVKQNNIQEFSKIPTSLVERILKMLSNDLGEPSVQKDDDVFNKEYQNFKRWIWIDEKSYEAPLRMSLTTYLDDSDFENIKWVINLSLSENIVP